MAATHPHHTDGAISFFGLLIITALAVCFIAEALSDSGSPGKRAPARRRGGDTEVGKMNSFYREGANSTSSDAPVTARYLPG
jgi:hypothetical protein